MMRIIAMLMTLLVAAALPAARAMAQATVLNNFTLIDGTGAPPSKNFSLSIDPSGRIGWVGPAGMHKIPREAKFIDLTGKYVIPGIIDAHVHLALVQGLKQDVDFYTADLVQEQLRTYAAYGVTSVVVMGTDKDLIFGIRDAQRRDGPQGARVFTTGQGIIYKGSYGGVPKLNQPVVTPDEARAAVDEQVRKGVDLVKFWVDDEFGSLPVKMPADISKAIIDQAHLHHLKVVAHIFYLDNARTLVEQGVDGLMHSVRDKRVDQDLLQDMKRRGTWQLAQTLSREASFVYTKLPFIDDPFFSRAVPPDVVSALGSPQRSAQLAGAANFVRYKPVFETAMSNTAEEVRAGIQYGMGTDSGPSGRFPGYFAHWELQLMVQAGLTPLQALTAATGSNAKFIGAADIGTIAARKWADLVVLDRDPLADIRNTRSIRQVYEAGHAVPTIWELCAGRPSGACSGGPDKP